ncbi:MAG: hypothetical protein NVSMB17_01610 [Candidatus Dormibacteria bacterium]
MSTSDYSLPAVGRRISAVVLPILLLALSIVQGAVGARPAIAASTPTLTFVSPSNGPISGGGKPVYLLGSGFTSDGVTSAVSSVTFGSKPATILGVDSDRQMRVSPPDNSVTAGGPGPGSVDVVVTTTSASNKKSFTYQPEIASLSPNSGSLSGHDQAVTISGTGFQFVRADGTVDPAARPAICFGRNAFLACNAPTICPSANEPKCPTTAPFTDTSIIVVPPAAPNGKPGVTAVSMKVNGQGNDQQKQGAAADKYNYSSATPPPPGQKPTIASRSGSTCCSQGNSVTLNGLNYSGSGNNLRVSFGNPDCDDPQVPTQKQVEVDTTFQVTGGSQITAVAPIHPAGTYDIGVHNDNGWSACTPGTGSNQDSYVYSLPSISSIDAAQGPTSGGTAVPIHGTVGGEDFKASDTAVDFGGTPACNGDCALASDSGTIPASTLINAVSPPHPAGTVHVHVVNGSGASPETASDQFNYIAPQPVVSSVSPVSGSSAGGNPITVTGTGLSFADGVWLYTSGPACGVTGNSCVQAATCPAGCSSSGDTSIVFTAPTHRAGPVDVLIHTGGGFSSVGPGDVYTYNPDVTAVSPNRGPASGGLAQGRSGINIGGHGFTGATGVAFGTVMVAPGGFAVVSDTQINVTVPPAHNPNDPLTVDVRVSGPSSTISPVNAPADQYTYVGAPSVTAVSPSTGGVPGGSQVRVFGSGFLGGTSRCNVGSVTFGGASVVGPPSNCTDSSLLVTAPRSANGASTVNVRVSTGNGGMSPVNSADQFTYQHGYNILTGAGGIYSFGDAGYFGNLIDHGYPGPAIGLSETPEGRGYAIVTTPGNLYTFGDAVYFGNLNDPCNNGGGPCATPAYPGPAVAFDYTPRGVTTNGAGYAILTGGGGLYSFGDAQAHYYGNLIDCNCIPAGANLKAVSFAWTASGNGYWILADNGGIYSFGDAVDQYHGNLLDHGYPGSATGLTRSADGRGYSILTQEGGIYSFGDAVGQYYGNLIDHGYPAPGVAFSSTP